jgi:hypothetical protein
MNVWLKRVGYTIGAIVALLLIIVSFVYGMSEREFRKTYSGTPESGSVSDGSATIARGVHFALIVGCDDCHGANRPATS